MKFKRDPHNDRTHPGCRVFEGDICVTDKEFKHLNRESFPSDSLSNPRAERAVVKKEFMKWIDGVVPYVFAPDLSELIKA